MEHFSAPLHTTALQVVRRKCIMELLGGIGEPRPKNSPLDCFCLHYVQARPFRFLLFKYKMKKLPKELFHFGAITKQVCEKLA